MSAQAGLGTGLEAGDPGDGDLEWQRARTRIVLGADFGGDEDLENTFGVGGYIDLEERGGLGVYARYSRWLTPSSLGLNIQGIAAITPNTLVGIGAGATFVIPFGERVGLFLEPTVAILPVGSDLPGDSPITWILFSAGVRLGL